MNSSGQTDLTLRRGAPVNNQGKLAASVAGGTLLSASTFPPWADLLQTALLAAVGAAVSFFTAWLLQWLTRKRRH